MFYKEQGFTQGFLAVLNRCVAPSFFTASQETKQNKQYRPATEITPWLAKSLARERYLAIPTFIRQGKILNL